MNQRISSLIVVVVALFASCYVAISVISGQGNEIGRLAIYLSVASLGLGLVSPKVAMYMLLFLAAYSDLIKRFMILGSPISQLDLVYVLSMAPMVLIGVVLRLFSSRLIRMQVTKGELIRFAFCSLVLLVIGGGILLQGGSIRLLRIAADYGVFVYLLYVLPIMFPARVDMLKYGKAALIVFVPVAIYGIWQAMFGLSNFEISYLQTGLSGESRQLNEVQFRGFSTLNAASSLTMVMAACSMLTYLLLREKLLGKLIGGLMLGLFIAGCISTFTRAGWVCLAISPFVGVAFRYKLTTFLGYGTAVIAFIVMVFYSDTILDNLHGWQGEINSGTEFAEDTQAFRVTTLYDRFLGFKNMRNPDNWTPFGKVSEESVYGLGRYDSEAFSHDMVSGFLFRRGYIPSAIVLLLGGFLIFKVHLSVLRQPMGDRKMTSIAMGSAAALLISTLAGTYIFQFPANIFLWIMVCITINYLSDPDHQDQFEQSSD